jgi:hypothetical protein
MPLYGRRLAAVALAFLCLALMGIQHYVPMMRR